MIAGVSADRWRSISAVLDEALELPPDSRKAFLDKACGRDHDLRRHVADLLDAADRSAGFLEAPPFVDAPSFLREVAGEASKPPHPEGDPGSSIGPYRLVRRIGEGGMGDVWLAEQESPVRRRVALKVIKAGMDTRQVIARFEAERQALAMMDHPGIAKMFEAGATPRGLPYFVMEHVEGEPIVLYCDRRGLPLRRRLDLFLKVCDGVQHAHQRGIIHRDLKPSNVLVWDEGGEPAPKIIDFGVAKATAQRLTERTLMTEQGMLIGTPEYMSPEQAEGLDADTRTDVYALGMVLYELLSGSLPFDPKRLRACGLEEIRRTIRNSEPPRPSARVRASVTREAAASRGTDAARLSARLRGDLDWIVMKALEKDPARRYGSPGELASDIRRHLSFQPVAAGPPSPVYRTRKFVRRHRFGVGASAIALGGIVALAAMMAVQARRVAHERDRAERVAEVLMDLFKVSDPSESRGNTITAREILDRGAERIEHELRAEPDVQAQLMDSVGQVYSGLGLYEKAEGLLGRALELRRSALGSQHPDTLASMTRLGFVLSQRARLPESEALFREAYEVRRRLLGPEHPDTLATAQQLAIACFSQSRFAEAERLAGDAYETGRRALGPEHATTLAARSVLAMAYGTEGRFEEAVKMEEETLAARRRVLGLDHPDTLQSMNRLALLYNNLNRLDEADRLYRETIDLKRRVLGPEHFETLKSLDNLGYLCGARGRMEEAGKIFRDSFETGRRALGPEHPETLRAMSGLATWYSSQGRHEQAEALRRQTLEIWRRVVGPDNHMTIAAISALASVCEDVGRHDEAEKLYRDALEARRRVFGAEHPYALLGMFDLAAALLREKKIDEAERLLRQALEIRRRVPGTYRPEISDLNYGLACVAALRGRREQAIAQLRLAVDAGFRDADGMARDPDLRSLRGTNEFASVMAGIRKKAIR